METENHINQISDLVDYAVKKRRTMQAIVIVGLGVLAAIAIFFITTDASFFQFGSTGKFGLKKPNTTIPKIIAIVATGVMAFALWQWANKSFERAMAESMMPILCKMAGGYEYRQSGFDGCDQKLISCGLFEGVDVTRNENHVSGTLADVGFRYWSTEMLDRQRQQATATKSRSTKLVTIFKGYIIEMPATDNVSEVVIRPVRNAIMRGIKQAFGFSGPFQYRSDIELHNAKGTDYAVFMPTDENETEILDWAGKNINATNEILDRDSQVFGVLQDSSKLYLAIRDSSPLFSFRGLFSNRAKIVKDAERALGEILIPLKIIQIWKK